MSADQQAGRHGAEFLAEVRARRARHEKHRKEGDASFWASVSAMGTIGWSVSVPTALGVLLGRWVDGRLESAHIFMVFCMLVGLGVGCFTAWRIISEKL